jgi:hypothetical protein
MNKPPVGKHGGFLYATRHNFSSAFNNYNSNGFDRQSKLVRVTSAKPCRICGRKKYCSYTEDGTLVLCTKTSAGSIKIAENGSFIHVLNPQHGKRVSAYSATSISKCGNSGKSTAAVYRADADRTNEVYTFFLNKLELIEQHADNLLYKRGLSDTTIAAKLYASVPSDLDLADLMKKVREKFGDNLKGVAGFYKDGNGIWQFNKPQSGFFVPYRDEKGRIQAMMVRQNITGKNKYIWVSTNPDNEKFKNGTSSGAPLHFVLPDLVKETGEIIITEGALKADCISEFTGKSVVALAGVTCANFQELPANLKKALPELQKVLIAYDADFVKNDHVRVALVKLNRSLKRFGYEVSVLQWDLAHGKGLDDLLLNDNREVENER